MADLNVLIELINSAGVLGLLLFLLFCLIKGWLITKSQAEDIKATAKQSAETTARIVVSKLSERIEKHEDETNNKIVTAVRDGVAEAIKSIMPAIQHSSAEVVERLRSIESEVASLKRQEKERSGRL